MQPSRWATAHRAVTTAASITGAVLFVAFAAAPTVVYPAFLEKMLTCMLLAAAFNLLSGYGSMLSFGHAALFGTAAYVTAQASVVWGWSPGFAIVLGVAASAALGVVFGLVSVRRQGIQFAMVTLALAQTVYFVFLQAPFTHGEDGLQNVPQGWLFGLLDLSRPLVLYEALLVLVSLALMLLWRIVHSPFGQAIAAIRENEARAISLGYRTWRYKVVLFGMSAAFAGLAGSLQALSSQIATLGDVTWQRSGEVILMTLLGGIGTFYGPLVGAALVVCADYLFAASDVPAPVLTGTLFIVCVLLFRRGLVGEVLYRWMNRRAVRGAHRDAPAEESRIASAVRDT